MTHVPIIRLMDPRAHLGFDFIEIAAQAMPTSVAVLLKERCPGTQTRLIVASPTSQGRLVALARIIAGGLRYLISIGWFPRRPRRVAIVSHVALAGVLIVGRALGWPIRYVLMGPIVGPRRSGTLGSLHEWLYGLAIRRAEQVLCYSRRECDLYSRRFDVPRDCFRVIPCKVNISSQWRPRDT